MATALDGGALAIPPCPRKGATELISSRTSGGCRLAAVAAVLHEADTTAFGAGRVAVDEQCMCLFVNNTVGGVDGNNGAFRSGVDICLSAAI